MRLDMSERKKLLTFAHRGEAQAFLMQYDFKPVEFLFDGLFECSDLYLLITGEGPHNASEKTVSVLGRFFASIEQVYNIGIAGSLSPKLKKNNLVWVRSVFAHHAEKLEFKSFTSSREKTHHDCMTAYVRVLSQEERLKFTQFAHIVDRELWAVASAAQLFKVPFYCLKIISDDMDSSGDICKFVKMEAMEFSQKLLREFQEELSHGKKSVPEKKEALDLLEDLHFYFTTSQERKLISLLQNLEKKGTSQKKLDIETYRKLELSPKDRSRALIQYLNDELNPISKKIRMSLYKKLSPLSDASISASFDPDFESDWLQLSMKVQSSRDLEKIKNALKIFSYEEFKEVLNGKLDDHV